MISVVSLTIAAVALPIVQRVVVHYRGLQQPMDMNANTGRISGRAVPSVSAWRRFFQHGYVKLAIFITLSAASYLFFSRVIVMAVEVQGVSMSPTLQNGDLVLLNRFAYIRRMPQRGELVVLRDPETDELVVKRIIGLPEERVSAGSDHAFVNGRLLFEPYIFQAAKSAPEKPNYSIAVPRDHFYVLGDNRHYSVDSRSFGTVPRDRILGVINLR